MRWSFQNLPHPTYLHHTRCNNTCVHTHGNTFCNNIPFSPLSCLLLNMVSKRNLEKKNINRIFSHRKKNYRLTAGPLKTVLNPKKSFPLKSQDKQLGFTRSERMLLKVTKRKNVLRSIQNESILLALQRKKHWFRTIVSKSIGMTPKKRAYAQEYLKWKYTACPAKKTALVQDCSVSESTGMILKKSICLGVFKTNVYCLPCKEKSTASLQIHKECTTYYSGNEQIVLEAYMWTMGVLLCSVCTARAKCSSKITVHERT